MVLGKEDSKKLVKPSNNATSCEVIFQYNGHSFEAYESLGLSPGASLEEVETAYKKAPKNNVGEVEEIIRLAYLALTRN